MNDSYGAASGQAASTGIGASHKAVVDLYNVMVSSFDQYTIADNTLTSRLDAYDTKFTPVVYGSASNASVFLSYRLDASKVEVNIVLYGNIVFIRIHTASGLVSTANSEVHIATLSKYKPKTNPVDGVGKHDGGNTVALFDIDTDGKIYYRPESTTGYYSFSTVYVTTDI